MGYIDKQWQALQDLQDDYQDIAPKDKQRFEKAMWKVGFWVLIAGAIALFFVLLPFILQHTAKIISATKDLKKSFRPTA
jgi:uncharacterized protein YpmS